MSDVLFVLPGKEIGEDMIGSKRADGKGVTNSCAPDVMTGRTDAPRSRNLRIRSRLL